MSQTVTLQLNATNVAGDWATRGAGASGTGTGNLGDRARTIRTCRMNEAIVRLAELRGAVETIKQGTHSPNLASTRTDSADVTYGTPALYKGIRFAIDAV